MLPKDSHRIQGDGTSRPSSILDRFIVNGPPAPSVEPSSDEDLKSIKIVSSNDDNVYDPTRLRGILLTAYTDERLSTVGKVRDFLAAVKTSAQPGSDIFSKSLAKLSEYKDRYEHSWIRPTELAEIQDSAASWNTMLDEQDYSLSR
jgi:hypothetical protein